ncbi:hypothetical protein DICVIV_08585 [Dictyocaulus viviparus]|uniref:Peptidase M1 membrane alanine aminopeptidase domain-containing protein n=1 Tax=Dictyocaulus viviparus TaxID=29172 RepID=A0A0D8XNQ5_DICVI|nr:hypothetical protein DICVIV_08585 [Dictyocaulus viviparus]
MLQSTLDHPALVRPLTTELEVERSYHETYLHTKGSVMVIMIRELVSEFQFHSGMRRYLRKNAYRSVSRHELWESMPAYADHGADREQLSTVMERWLMNEGIPEVSIVQQLNYGFQPKLPKWHDLGNAAEQHEVRQPKRESIPKAS